jgi:uncharacterized protein (DUF2235 family)
MYEFISNNYESGDELFFFGFSRGAFTVRSVAGLVSNIGVLSAVHMSRFAEMWEAYRANTDRAPFRQSEWYRKNEKELGLKDVRVKVVGVWDTVGALVWPSACWLDAASCVCLTYLAGNPTMARRGFIDKSRRPYQQEVRIPQHHRLEKLVQPPLDNALLEWVRKLTYVIRHRQCFPGPCHR